MLRLGNLNRSDEVASGRLGVRQLRRHETRSVLSFRKAARYSEPSRNGQAREDLLKNRCNLFEHASGCLVVAFSITLEPSSEKKVRKGAKHQLTSKRGLDHGAACLGNSAPVLANRFRVVSNPAIQATL